MAKAQMDNITRRDPNKINNRYTPGTAQGSCSELRLGRIHERNRRAGGSAL